MEVTEDRLPWFPCEQTALLAARSLKCSHPKAMFTA